MSGVFVATPATIADEYSDSVPCARFGGKIIGNMKYRSDVPTTVRSAGKRANWNYCWWKIYWI